MQLREGGLEMRLLDIFVGDGVDRTRSVDDATHIIDQHRKKRRHRNERKAGAIAWGEITSESWLT